jgi:hypothetical protein
MGRHHPRDKKPYPPVFAARMFIRQFSSVILSLFNGKKLHGFVFAICVIVFPRLLRIIGACSTAIEPLSQTDRANSQTPAFQTASHPEPG